MNAPNEIRLDGRELEHPEPLERALAAMRKLEDGEYLHMLLHRCPYPLLELAEKQEFVHTEGEHEGVWHIFISKDTSVPLDTLLKEACDV